MTYKQAATAKASEAALKKDPENRLWWKMSTRRLDAEQIRDAILSATGKLDLKAGGPSADPKEPRRTVYTKVRRNTRDPLLDVFDSPEAFTSTAQRNVTTTPTQALLMFNSPFLLAQAKALADRLEKEKNADFADRAFRLVLGRAIRADERTQVEAFLREQTERAGGQRRAALVDFCHVMLNANEFLYVD